MTELTMVAALNAALRAALDDDSRVLLMGEDIGQLGGVFRVTDGLAKDFGELRVVDTPLAESGIVAAAVGLTLYFALAVRAHFRAADPVKEAFPAFGLLVVSAFLLVLGIAA